MHILLHPQNTHDDPGQDYLCSPEIATLNAEELAKRKRWISCRVIYQIFVSRLSPMWKKDSHQQPSILLQSRDHSEPLDVIDLLRSQGVSHYFSLPQLIVCGNQSSSKSSVLEAECKADIMSCNDYS